MLAGILGRPEGRTIADADVEEALADEDEGGAGSPVASAAAGADEDDEAAVFSSSLEEPLAGERRVAGMEDDGGVHGPGCEKCEKLVQTFRII